MMLSKILENKIPSNTYWKDLLICLKIQINSHLEPPLECNRVKTP